MYSWQQFSLCGLPFHSPNCLVTQKVFNFMRSFWSIIGFSFWANGALFRKFFSTLVSCGRVLMFVFFYQCHCLNFTFGSLIHLELIFMQSDSYWPNFILLHVDIRFSQQHLLKMLPPTHTHTHFLGGIFVKYLMAEFMDAHVGSSVLFHWSTCLFLCQYYIVLIILLL